MLIISLADIKLRTILWVSTSFLIISSFLQRFFYRRDIFSSKDFSWWLGKLLLTSLFKYSEKESFFCLRGLIHNFTDFFNSQILRCNFWKLSSVLETDIEVRWFSMMGVRTSLGISVSSVVNCWAIADISFVISIASDDFSELPKALFMMSSNRLLMR